jgi:two-component system nitrogen regulation sensor histidine kinase GlnL
LEVIDQFMATGHSNMDAGNEEAGLADMLQGCFECGIVSVDSAGSIVALTPLAQRLLRLPENANQAQSSPTLPAPVQSIIQEAQKTGEPVADRRVVLGPTQSPTAVLSVTAMPVSFGKSAANVVVLLKDVSSTRKLNEHMRRLDRLASIGTLSASMAHEIKNALVPVSTFVGLLLEQNPDAELAGTVRREMKRVDSIVTRMLRFSGPSKPSFSAIRLHELLEHSLRLIQHRVEGNLVSFKRQFNAPSDSMSGDDYQLEQAFVNLLLNAVDAMGSEGQLTVGTDMVTRETGMALREGSSSPKWLRVDITDTGMGIAPENIGSIFDPFFTTKPHGTGLGLAVTRQIIEEHEGVIRVDSQPGKGTTFTVLLPVAPGTAAG